LVFEEKYLAWNKIVGPVWQYMIQYLGVEYRQIIQLNVPMDGDIRAAFLILEAKFQSSSKATIRNTLGELLLCRAIPGKLIPFTTDTLMISQRLLSLLPPDMTAKQLIELHISGLDA
jgi:hypothetical protein